MRTWSHIPTFYDLERFYQSNIANFPDSEVAYGNLGVTYIGMGYQLAAHDFFMRGTQINPDYDVNWYNLYSIVKGLPFPGNIDTARMCLDKAIKARICHFRDKWKLELVEFNKQVEQLKVNMLPQIPFTGMPLENATVYNCTS